jgi:hypothetical protein
MTIIDASLLADYARRPGHAQRMWNGSTAEKSWTVVMDTFGAGGFRQEASAACRSNQPRQARRGLSERSFMALPVNGGIVLAACLLAQAAHLCGCGLGAAVRETGAK